MAHVPSERFWRFLFVTTPTAIQNQSGMNFFFFGLVSNLLFMRCGVYKGLNQMNVTKKEKKQKQKKMPFLRASELQIIFKEKPIITSSQ
jgi:hypothetical protein